MDNMKPSQLALIGGGALVLVSTFLDWFSVGEAGFSFGYSGWETGSFGLLGIFVAAIGAIIALGGILTATGNADNIPDSILGFTHDQLHLALGLAAFIPTFGLQFSSGAALGITLGWIGAAAIIVGALMDLGVIGGGGGESPDAASPEAGPDPV